MQILQLEMAKFERDLPVPPFVGKATTGLAGRDLSQIARDVCVLAEDHGGSVGDEEWRAVIGRFAKATMVPESPPAGRESRSYPIQNAGDSQGNQRFDHISVEAMPAGSLLE